MQQGCTAMKTFLENIPASIGHASGQQLVCTMAMVCREWRAAVCLYTQPLSINLQFPGYPYHDAVVEKSMQKILSFAQWLPQHANIVNNIDVRWQRSSFIGDITDCWDSYAYVAYKTVLAPQVDSALQTAAAAAAAVLPYAGVSQQRMLGRWIQSFSSNVPHSSQTLQALSTAMSGSLMRLELKNCNIAVLAPIITQLPSLQVLQLEDTRHALVTNGVDATLRTIKQLTNLTSLQLKTATLDTLLLPKQLLELHLALSDMHVVDLLHLTQVTSLHIALSQHGRQPSVLPPQVVDLSIRQGYNSQLAASCHYKLTTLKRLRSLVIMDSIDSAGDLQQLATLPSLQNLSLAYRFFQKRNPPTLKQAQTWSNLCQLRSLQMEGNLPPKHMKAIMHHISSITGLTRLCLSVCMLRDSELGSNCVPLALCRYLSKVPALLHLSIDICGNGFITVEQSDVRHLSHLTRLTRLDFGLNPSSRYCGITDALTVEATHNLQPLTQLRELHITVCRSVTVLAAIGQLSYLTKLRVLLLAEAKENAEKGLKYLHGLKRLTCLEGFEDCAADVLANFWTNVQA